MVSSELYKRYVTQTGKRQMASVKMEGTCCVQLDENEYDVKVQYTLA